MENMVITLAIVIVPFLILTSSITLISTHFSSKTHRSMAWQRTRRSIQRALATGVLLR
jgi:cytochrome c oxidase assembly factor CtaG